MSRKIGLAALIAVLSLALGLALATRAGADSNKNGSTVTTSINNGGNNPNCGASCDQSHNPTDFEKACAAVPGNGCHVLPDTPCERGHGGTEIGNKHCGAGLTILKEQSLSDDFTHDLLSAFFSRDVFYRITVTNFTNTDYTLTAIDPLCQNPDAAVPLSPSGTDPQPLAALGTFVYTCDIDANKGQNGIPTNAQSGYALTNTVTVTATPTAGGSPVTLTDTVTATLN